jgi:hypothetical protein
MPKKKNGMTSTDFEKEFDSWRNRDGAFLTFLRASLGDQR